VHPLQLDAGLNLLLKWAERWYSHGKESCNVLIKRPASEEGHSEGERWITG